MLCERSYWWLPVLSAGMIFSGIFTAMFGMVSVWYSLPARPLWTLFGFSSGRGLVHNCYPAWLPVCLNSDVQHGVKAFQMYVAGRPTPWKQHLP